MIAIVESNPAETNTASMRAAEFETRVGSDRTIRLPDNTAARITAGKELRVVVSWQEPVVEFEDWTDEE